jgi:hypothetical protein
MRRIAAMPGPPAERFRYLKFFNATGRNRRRQAFVPMGKVRSLWDQIARHAPALLKEIPAGSSVVQRLRARTRKTDQRQALLSAIGFFATRARIMAIEQKILRRRSRRSASPSST